MALLLLLFVLHFQILIFLTSDGTGSVSKLDYSNKRSEKKTRTILVERFSARVLRYFEFAQWLTGLKRSIVVHVANIGDQHEPTRQWVLIRTFDRHGALLQIYRFHQNKADHIGLD